MEACAHTLAHIYARCRLALPRVNQIVLIFVWPFVRGVIVDIQHYFKWQLDLKNFEFKYFLFYPLQNINNILQGLGLRYFQTV